MRINIWIIFLIALVGCFLAVILFTLPSQSEYFNLSQSSKANVGTVIGGITAPIIGLFTSVLLIITLRKQAESNRDQRLKNESDMIFLLLNQLDNEIGSFYYSYDLRDPHTNKVNGTNNYKGIEALNNFALDLASKSSFPSNYSFDDNFACDQLLMITRSIKLISQRIKDASLSLGQKELFLNKLRSYYDCRLSFTFAKISAPLSFSSDKGNPKSAELVDFSKNLIHFMTILP